MEDKIIELVFLVFSIAKIIIGVLVVIFGALAFFTVLKGMRFRKKFDVKEAMKTTKPGKVLTDTESTKIRIMQHMEAIRKKWENILKKIESGAEGDLNLAIIKADSLIDEILCAHDCQGADMGERMKSLSRDDYKHLDDLWEAHKIRNRIAHDHDYHIKKDEALKVMNLYSMALEELLSKEIESI